MLQVLPTCGGEERKKEIRTCGRRKENTVSERAGGDAHAVEERDRTGNWRCHRQHSKQEAPAGATGAAACLLLLAPPRRAPPETTLAHMHTCPCTQPLRWRQHTSASAAPPPTHLQVGQPRRRRHATIALSSAHHRPPSTALPPTHPPTSEIGRAARVSPPAQQHSTPPSHLRGRETAP